MLRKNYAGKVFGRLTVTPYFERVEGRRKYKCLCSCGNSVYVKVGNLTSGTTKSCGCLKKESLKGKVFAHSIVIVVGGIKRNLRDVCLEFGLNYGSLVVYKQRKGVEALRKRVEEIIKEK